MNGSGSDPKAYLCMYINIFNSLILLEVTC